MSGPWQGLAEVDASPTGPPDMPGDDRDEGFVGGSDRPALVSCEFEVPGDEGAVRRPPRRCDHEDSSFPGPRSSTGLG